MEFYDRYAFLEHFDSENILDQEVGIVEYKLTTTDECILCFFMSPHEETVILSLKHPATSCFIYSIGLYDISKVAYDNKKMGEVRILFYIPNDELPAATLMLKPYVALDMSVRLNKGGL